MLEFGNIFRQGYSNIRAKESIFEIKRQSALKKTPRVNSQLLDLSELD